MLPREPWPHQTKAAERIAKAREEGARAPCVVIPTGGGKTDVLAAFARDRVTAGEDLIAFGHRQEIAEQIYDRCSLDFGLRCGFVGAKPTRPVDDEAPVQVGMLQTFLARGLKLRAKNIAFDECHHMVSDSWMAFAKEHEDAFRLGFTATPARPDGRGIGMIFDRIIAPVTVQELTAAGLLVPCEIIRPSKKRPPGKISARPVDAYLKHAPGRRAICFAANLTSAQLHVDEFKSRGMSAVLVTGSMSDAQRSAAIDAFRAGTVKVLVNYNVVTEGFDVRECDCVILAREIGSQTIYLQAIGRGLRSAPGKTNCIVLDLHGSSYVHGHPIETRIYSLEGRAIRLAGANDVDLDPGTSCRVCGAPTNPGEACLECGTEPRSANVVKVSAAPMVKFAAVRSQPIDAKIEMFARWIAEAREHRRDPKWYRIKWLKVMGHWPSRELERAALKLLEERSA